MGKLSLVVWFVIEGALALLSQFAQAPYNYIFFTITMMILAYMTFRAVLGAAQKECTFENMRRDFDRELMNLMNEQRLNLIESFERQRGEPYQGDDVEVIKGKDNRFSLRRSPRFRDRMQDDGTMRRRRDPNDGEGFLRRRSG